MTQLGNVRQSSTLSPPAKFHAHSGAHWLSRFPTTGMNSRMRSKVWLLLMRLETTRFRRLLMRLASTTRQSVVRSMESECYIAILLYCYIARPDPVLLLSSPSTHPLAVALRIAAITSSSSSVANSAAYAACLCRSVTLSRPTTSCRVSSAFDFPSALAA